MRKAIVKHLGISITIDFYTGDIDLVSPVSFESPLFEDYKQICKIFKFNLEEWHRFYNKPYCDAYHLEDLGHWYLDSKFRKQYIPANEDFRIKNSKR